MYERLLLSMLEKELETLFYSVGQLLYTITPYIIIVLAVVLSIYVVIKIITLKSKKKS